MASVLADIEQSIRPGTEIPKTSQATSGPYSVEEVWGMSRGEDALVYSIPSKTPGRPRSRKRIRKSDWIQAAIRLTTTGEFTTTYCREFMPMCYGDGSCNFTTIGGVFELLKYADRVGRSVYRRLPEYEGEG